MTLKTLCLMLALSDMQQYNLRMQQQYGEIRPGYTPRGMMRGYAPAATYRQRGPQGQVVRERD